MSTARPAQPSLTIHLMGGLGNQLFQYAFGRQLALRNGAELWLDARGYGRDGAPDPNTGLREFELAEFNIQARVIRTGDALGGGAVLRRRVEKVLRLVRRIADQFKPYFARQEIVEPQRNAFRFDAKVLNRRFTGSVSARGFWQSEKYFAGIEDDIRHELTIRSPLPSKVASIVEEILETSSVAVHVRHGDNATEVAARLGVLPRAYYEAAIREIAEQVVNPRFFLFSDDPDWAAASLLEVPSLKRVSSPSGTGSHIDLHLMALCKHHIIANSTFSWWGAWLGKKEGQIVYAPRRYYQNADQPNPDLYPANWRLI